MRSTVKTYLQLIRLPNAFTAMADVAAGFLACGGSASDWRQWGMIAAASACLYSGGIVLNDICDLETDRRERPSRPLPSGRVGLVRARFLAVLLLASGLAVAAFAGGSSAIVAAILVGLIVLYNTWAKRISGVGPLCMGSCRFANVFLGGAAAGAASFPWIPAILIAGLVVGATMLSRDEVAGGQRRGVAAASAVVGVIVALAMLWLRAGDRDAWGWLFLLTFLTFTTPGLVRAWRVPSPAAIQDGVKRLVLGIIPLDAVVAAGAAGPLAGCLVLGLLIPSWGIARWIYVT
jgi:4-hydroxybenzoate polyprenyltransferase